MQIVSCQVKIGLLSLPLLWKKRFCLHLHINFNIPDL